MTSPQAPLDQTKYFFELTPDRVLDAVQSAGLIPTGRCMALNSFENRVYDVELETPEGEMTRRVIKFYRPGRWTREQIVEEHEFIADLVKAEIPAIAPIPFENGETLKHDPASGIWYAVFPKVGGRAPDELTDEQLKWIGRLLARIHNAGAARKANHRIQLTADTYGRQNLKFLLDGNWIPLEFQSRYRDTVEKICAIAAPWIEAAPVIRLHGDCHLGNLLWNQQGPFFLDFDDMVIGPPVQDLWLLIPGRDQASRWQLDALLEGYEEMRSFDYSTLKLIEVMRALRFVHYTAWVAKRWEDPAFPLAFPQFNSHRYWADETADLERQLQLIEESAQNGPKSWE